MTLSVSMERAFLNRALRREFGRLLVFNLYFMEKLVQMSREFALREIEQYGLPHVLQFDISEKKAIELAQTL